MSNGTAPTYRSGKQSVHANGGDTPPEVRGAGLLFKPHLDDLAEHPRGEFREADAQSCAARFRDPETQNAPPDSDEGDSHFW